MKPTKEQLASTKWWRDNVPDDLDFLYECESTGEIAFANRDGRDNDGLRLRLELDIWKLLAKRPEPENKKIYWVAKVDCYGTPWNTDGPHESYSKANEGCELLKQVNKKDKYIVTEMTFKKIKTQREEFIEEAKSRIKNMDADDIILAGKLYDAGCRFDLTEKDGE